MAFFTPELYELAKIHEPIDPSLYGKYHVKRGLRNEDGTGVITGITEISNVHGYIVVDDEKIPDKGKLTIRGYDIGDIVQSHVNHNTFGFEDLSFLLLFGKLATKQELEAFNQALDEQRDLPQGFVHSLVLTAPSDNTMNMMARSILNLYAFDRDANNICIEHEIDVASSLISRLVRIGPLAYYAHQHDQHNEEMIWHPAKAGLSSAETILYMLRKDSSWDPEEAQLLDIMLMLHAEHGGGNNSTFSCRTLSSTFTDPYAAYAGAISSLKGPKHGGANIKVSNMIDDLKEHVSDITDEGQVADYLRKLLRKEAFDRSGLIYGMGHAIYTISDARTEVVKSYAQHLAYRKGDSYARDFDLIDTIERLTPELMSEKSSSKKILCANIDMYSGLIYKILGIPDDLVTPVFAMARISGWAAHRMEELFVSKRIIRPAYKSMRKIRPFVPIDER
ncbi:MAG: citrate synthase [Coriobacteriia bacterium]|nr:citrate synthase [Coriobacteriia bacterium]